MRRRRAVLDRLPVGINTGELVHVIRGREMSALSRGAAGFAAGHFPLVAGCAAAMLRLASLGRCVLGARIMASAPRIAVPAVVCGEIDAGTQGDTARAREEREAFSELLAMPNVSVLPVTRTTGSFYARVFAYSHSAGRPIPTNDVWIAAAVLGYLLHLLVADRFGGRVTWDELGLPVTETGLCLPCGSTGRWCSE